MLGLSEAKPHMQIGFCRSVPGRAEAYKQMIVFSNWEPVLP